MAKYRFEDIAFNSTAKKKPVEEDRHTYLGLEHLDGENLQVTRFGAEVAPKGDKLLMKKGDVLFGKRRAYQKKVAIAPFDGIFSAHGMVLRPKEDIINKDFFPFFISSDYFLDAAIKISVGSLSPTINWRDLKELEFDLPDIEEQERLAKILWAAEDLKRKCAASINNVIETKTSYIGDFLKDNIDTHSIALKDISNVTSGLWVGKKPPFTNCKIIRNTNFTKDCNLDYNSIPEYEVQINQLETRTLQAGDLIVEKSGGSPDQPVGRVVLFDINDDSTYSYSNFTSKITIHNKDYSPEYIQALLTFYYLNGDTRIMQAQTTGISNLNMELFLEQSFPIISDKMQLKFMSDIKEFDKMCKQLKIKLEETNVIIKNIINNPKEA